jgi:choline dehydrogenase-like flavoprotein
MKTRQQVYDVVIIGSGAAGGTSAKLLVEGGLKVAMLEAGPLRKPLVDFPYHHDWPYDQRYRGFKNAKPDDEFSPRYSFIKNPDEPYTNPKDLPYDWFRARNVGGRTLFWGRFANRFNELDFKGYSRDGHGLDWPVEYRDVGPYYDKVERFMGVCGAKENHPDVPDGESYLEPAALKCPDWLLKRASEKIGIRTVRARRAMLTKAYGGYAQCHFCAECDRGCETNSFYTSAYRQIVPLTEKFPKTFTLIPNAMARQIKLNDKGLADEVVFIDKSTGQDRSIRGRVVVVACGTLESTRLLLLSKIANSSGMIGKNFLEHIDATGQAFLPDLSFATPYAGDGIGGSHIIIPWFGYFREKNEFDFVRGFLIEPSVRLTMTPPKNPKSIAGFGAAYKREVRRWYGTRVRLACHGEMLPSPKKFVELDDKVTDKWGMPVLRVIHPWEENDYKMFKRIQQTYEEIFTAAKGVDISIPKNPDTPGHSIHEMGTAHMGSDPKDSVLNKFNQSWDVKNLFVLDAAAFASGTHKNPTLTIMALSWRASEYMLEEMKKGSL